MSCTTQTEYDALALLALRFVIDCSNAVRCADSIRSPFAKGLRAAKRESRKDAASGMQRKKQKRSEDQRVASEKCMGAVLTVVFLYAGSYRHYGLQRLTARLLAESEQFSGPVNRVSCCQLSALSVTAVSPVSSSVSSIKSLTGQASGALLHTAAIHRLFYR